MMQEQGFQLFKEIGQDLAQALQSGREFSQTIATYPFFKKELEPHYRVWGSQVQAG